MSPSSVAAPPRPLSNGKSTTCRGSWAAPVGPAHRRRSGPYLPGNKGGLAASSTMASSTAPHPANVYHSHAFPSANQLVSDVLVIGGGVIGCGIAHALVSRGAPASLSSSRALSGEGASRASAGMLAPFSEGRHDRALQALGARSLSRYDALVADAGVDEGVAVPYVRDGLHRRGLRRRPRPIRWTKRRGALAEDGIAFERLDSLARPRPRALALAESALGGLQIPAHGAVGRAGTGRPRCGARRRSRGATLVRRARIASCRTRLVGACVWTRARALEAPHVVLAAGSWAGQVDVDGVAPLPVQPVRGQLLGIEADVGTLRTRGVGPGVLPGPVGRRHGPGRRDGRTRGIRRAGDGRRRASLLHAATALMPALADADVSRGRGSACAPARSTIGRWSVPSSRMDGPRSTPRATTATARCWRR